MTSAADHPGAATDVEDGANPYAWREAESVELVDERGAAVGSTSVDLAHRAPGLLHRAFSVLLFDGSGRLLLQRRAARKTRFALCLASTCCGHPGPLEPVTVAAARRLGEELGLHAIDLTEIGVYRYRAADPASNRVENEFDHVLVGLLPAGRQPVADPAEVAELHWVDPEQLGRDLAAPGQERYAPWLHGVIATWRSGRDGGG